MWLYLPAGREYVTVRTHPPICVPERHIGNTWVFVYAIKSGSNYCKRVKVERDEQYPEAFVAWDEDKDEWAVHETGEDSIFSHAPSTIIRGESETIDYKKTRRKRRTFAEWWASHSWANDDPDFLKERRKT